MTPEIPTEIPQVARGDEGFDAHLRALVFNKLPLDRAPDVVVRPRTEDEVVEIVRRARRDGQKVAIRSGGHSWIAAPVRAGGVLIDMSAFDRVEVDAGARTVRLGPAARSGEVARTLARHGFAYSSGHCGTPGVGGYLLGGGLGLNFGHWKPACYSIVSVRVVTAAGDVLVASESEHRELLWLARGAGPSFPGVVTEFEVELQDRPADTRVSSWVFDLADVAAVGRWVGEASRDLPSHVEVFTAAGGPERHDHLPRDGYPERIVTVLATAYVDSADAARDALAPLAAGPGFPALDHTDLEPVPFEELSASFDAEYPEDHCYLADAFWTDLDVEAALGPLEQLFREAPSGMNNFVALMPGHGSLLGLNLEDGAYSMDERTLVMAYAIWTDPAVADANRRWIARMSKTLEPISSGNFVSEADLEAYPSRLASSFSPESWDRVSRLRGKWDPESMFQVPGRATQGRDPV